MINYKMIQTSPVPCVGARGVILGYEIRGLRSGDGTRSSGNQDLLDTGIAPSRGFLPPASCSSLVL